MVKSGLDEDQVEKQKAARVSSCRLAAHLTSAVALYSILIYSGFAILAYFRFVHFKKSHFLI